MAGRERPDPGTDSDQAFGLGGKDITSLLILPVIEGTDPHRVARGDVLPGPGVIQDQGELRVQEPEHLRPEFPVHGEQDLAVRIAVERIAALLQALPHLPKAVQLSVAHDSIAVHNEGLHAFRREPHDREPVEAQVPMAGLHQTAVIRSPRDGPGQHFRHDRRIRLPAAVCKY